MSKSGKGQPGRKRPAKQPDDFFWDCSVCTYKNNPEAFKCVICDVRKGTSTRKSRVNPDLVAVQVQHALLPPPIPAKLLNRMNAEEQDDDDDEDDEGDEMEEPSTSQDMPPPASPAEVDEPAPSTSSAPIVMMPFPGACGGRPLKSLKKAAKKAASKAEKPPKPPKPVNTIKSKFKNVDRKNATSMNITVDNVTVMITEYKLKQKKDKKESNSSNSSLVGDSLQHMNEDSMDKPSTSSKAGSGADSESESGRMGGGPARGSSEELETTRSSQNDLLAY